jgi:hypothetical protein
MSTRYRIEVTLPEDDPSEVLDWIQEHSGDETASVEDLLTVLSTSTPATDRDAIWATLQTLDLAHYRITRVDIGDGPVVITDLDHALAEATSGDEAWVFVEKDGVHGWIRFVLGNEPFEVICDHTVNLSDVLDPLTEGWDQ